MAFREFSQQIIASGLTPKNFGNGHWQIVGRNYIVNFYPFARKGPSVYVNGLNSGQSFDTIEKAMRTALAATRRPPEDGPYRQTTRRRLRPARGRKLKRRLFAKRQVCYWCGVMLALDHHTPGCWFATLDHLVPLSKGGTNGQDNQVLACVGCSHNCGNTITEETPWRERQAERTTKRAQ